MKSFDQQVADWARTKPADEAYNYTSPCNCAIAQFLIASGISDAPGVGDEDWLDYGAPNIRHPISKSLNMAVLDHPRTFGALADRLSS
jgi:hypothetical protein